MVSIVTPYFNTGPVFDETVTSVLSQSFQSWEWIVVDDGSTDPESLEQLRVVESSDERISVRRQPNKGPAAARNTGISAARGTYIALLDSDDLLEPTYLEVCIWFLESENEFAFVNTWTVNFGAQEFLWQSGFERGVEHLQANSGPPITVIRKSACVETGGFDEGIREGHEDWDFWLRMAAAGLWGFTLPEYLAWYRQRQEGRFQQFMRDPDAHERFSQMLTAKYAMLKDRFPSPQMKRSLPYESPPYEVPFANRLDKPAGVGHVLFILPWMVAGGADRVNIDWIAGLIERGYRVTVCATLRTYHTWLHKFHELTKDVFVLPFFLQVREFPRFLTYLISSRQIETVVIAGSTFGYYFLPYLRSRCPETVFVDISHVVEEHWLNGGHPRFAVGYQDLLDLNIVTSDSLRSWMLERGAEPSRIAVCYTGTDTAIVNPTLFEGHEVNRRYGFEPDRRTIIFVGRMCQQKRPLLVCDILAELCRRSIRFQALMIGSGELFEDVRQRLSETALEERVVLCGSLSHSDWLDALAVSDILLLPSEYEGISVALYESMAMEVVPVTTSVGGQDELVVSSAGILLPDEGDQVQLYADAVAQLIEKPALAAEMGRAARDRILEHFRASQCVDRFVESLTTAKKNSKTDPRYPVACGTGQELATFAVEFQRISVVLDELWRREQTERVPPFPTAVRLLTLTMETRLGQALRRNQLVRRLAARLATLLEARVKANSPGNR